MSSIALGRPAALPFLRLPFVVAFAAAALAAGLGRAVTTTYLPLLLERINDAPGLIGMVMLVNAGAGMAVPLVVGLWSDRLGRSGHGRRLPFILGGAVVTAGGLLAIALGSSTSYLVLALSAAVVYTGLNAVTTAHRALIPETFDASGRPKATSAQELAMLVGGLLGLAVGGALTGLALWAPFALSAILVPLLALPTLRRVTEPEEHEPAEPRPRRGRPATTSAPPPARASAASCSRRSSGCSATPRFPPSSSSTRRRSSGSPPAPPRSGSPGSGSRPGMGIVLAGRVKNPALHRPLLLAGIVLLGGGFLGVGLSTSLVPVGAALVLGAAGFGLVSTLGFPLFSAMIPEREAGAYTALYFSVRSISSTIALPAAGWTVQATGSYRSLFLLGGIATMTALVPLVGLPRVKSRLRLALGLLAVVPVLGLLVAQTGAHRFDEWLYSAINGLGPGPEVLWTILDPHTRNYLVLIAVALAAAAVTSLRSVPATFARVLGSALLAWGLLEAVYSVYDRPRPEEVVADPSLNGHSWAHLNSFPSGHMAITAALAVAVALRFPRLRFALWALRRRGRLHARVLRRALPLRRRRRHRARHGERAARRARVRAAPPPRRGRRAAARLADRRRGDAVLRRRSRAGARPAGARARRPPRARRRRLARRRRPRARPDRDRPARRAAPARRHRAARARRCAPGSSVRGPTRCS